MSYTRDGVSGVSFAPHLDLSGRRIRTSVDVVNRFTVCPVWPLRYCPLFHSCAIEDPKSQRRELNRQPAVYKTAALPLSYAGATPGRTWRGMVRGGGAMKRGSRALGGPRDAPSGPPCCEELVEGSGARPPRSRRPGPERRPSPPPPPTPPEPSRRPTARTTASAGGPHL